MKTLKTYPVYKLRIEMDKIIAHVSTMLDYKNIKHMDNLYKNENLYYKTMTQKQRD